MKTIISGPVTQRDIDDADLLAGIVPTSYITNGKSTPPASQLETTVMPVCPKLPDSGVRQRDYTMCLNADALIVSGPNEHLVGVARSLKLTVYQA